MNRKNVLKQFGTIGINERNGWISKAGRLRTTEHNTELLNREEESAHIFTLLEISYSETLAGILEGNTEFGGIQRELSIPFLGVLVVGLDPWRLLQTNLALL